MKKEITLGNLISAIVALIALVGTLVIPITTRISNNESNSKSNSKDILKVEKSIIKGESATMKQADKIDENYKLIQEKLDKILYLKINNSTP